MVLIGQRQWLAYEYSNGSSPSITSRAQTKLAAGDLIRYTIAFAGAGGGTPPRNRCWTSREKFGVAMPGKPGYQPLR